MFKYLLALMFSSSVWANIVNPIDFEQNPNSLEWKKIDSEHFEIIFPQEVQAEAQKVAHLLEKAYPYVSRSLEVQPAKISLVLQNQSMQSNGFVTLAPRRSEWYLTPGYDPIFSNTEWLKSLAVHEFRHVVQFQKTRRGFNKFLEIVLGEIGQALGLGLTLPPWFLEGDAVGIETALTTGGRGRLPLFERNLKALLLSGEKFNYDKSHMGSYEDYIPNHYVFGYFYTTYLRNIYGDLFLSKLANESAESSYNPLTFYNSVDHLTGQRFEKFYAHVMRDMIKSWKEKLSLLSPTPYRVQNLVPRFGWTNYDFPQVTSDKKMVALKNGLSYINHFVLIDGDHEETLFYPGPMGSEYPYKLRQDRLAYVELQLDPRWGYRDYTKIKVYDLKKREVIFEKADTKARLATLNQSGSKVLFVEWNEKQEQWIVVSDLKGKSKYYRFPKKLVITSLDWKDDDSVILVLKDERDLKSVVEYSFTDLKSKVLLVPIPTNLGYVTVQNANIFLESPQSGIDNIFLLQDGALKQLTSSTFGAYAPYLDGQELVYNDYSDKGMNIVRKIPIWNQEEKSQDSFVPFYQKFSQEEKKDEFEFDLTEIQKYKTSAYSQVKNAVNLHSWILMAPPLSPTVSLLGFSRDILNKFSLSVGGSYNLNEQTTTGLVEMSWSHYYPVFDLGTHYGTRAQNIIKNGKKRTHKWEEGVAQLGVQVPWKRVAGKFLQSFSTRVFSKLIVVTNKISKDPTEVRNGALFSPGVELNFTMVQRQAQRDLLPPWGIKVDANVEEGHDITGVDQKGLIQSIDTRAYIPGFWHHHSFNHQFAFEKQRDDAYQYSSFIYYPRGTSQVFLEEFTKYSANYTLPLFNPDWNWSRYLYLKRVTMNLFYDELHGRFRGFDYKAASAGWEVLFETHFLRIILPFSWGVRGSYLINGIEKNNYEFFLSSVLGTF